LEFATQQELDPDYGTTVYSARVWAQVSLPYRNPGDVPYWERRNGNAVLTMRPALLFNADMERYGGYAFGMLPRQALTWIATQAVLTKDPVISLGSSMSAFMEKIGLHRGGRDAARLTDQMKRLFGSQLSISGVASNEAGAGESTKYFHIADEFQLWHEKSPEEGGKGRALWNSEVTLSKNFFESILDRPFPVNLEAMRALGSSPLRMDIYLWATYRVFNLRHETKISWVELNQHFGAQYAGLPQFKSAFIKHLAEVRVVYDTLNIEPTKDYLIVRPSPPHVLPAESRAEFI
jgi:hypothetical protein